jgi:diacylglycerol kinase (ATP)
MNILVIANPVSGTGKTVKRVQEFTAMLESRGHRVEVFLTGQAGDAVRRACQVASHDRLVVAGGDGTVNEVLNGLPEPSCVPILHMPTGTANQLAQHLGLPKHPGPLVNILEHGSVKKLDMGKIGNHRFLLQASAGFDALVTRVIEEGPRKGAGYFAYAVPIVKAVLRRTSTALDISVNGEKQISGQMVMVTKVRYYGGIFVFTKQARLDSGRFEICVFQSNKIRSLFMYAFAGLAHLASIAPGISHLTGSRVRIDSKSPVPVQIDGTYLGTTPVEIELLPAAVPVVVPYGKR